MKLAAPLPIDIRLMQALGSLLLAIAVLLAMAAGLWWLARMPVFALQGITVEGEVTRNNALTIKANVVPNLSGNFFTLDLDRTREAFESVPWVRAAVVHREFPNRLRVKLLEQQPVALWGEEGSSSMLNQQGQVFEANVGEVEADSMPRLKGPDNHSQDVLAMYRQLSPLLRAMDITIDQLELSPRGSWKLLTDHGGVIELGRGQPQELVERLQVFLRTVGQVAARYGRTPRSLAAADLRHKDGYALRLHGVTTTEAVAGKKP